MDMRELKGLEIAARCQIAFDGDAVDRALADRDRPEQPRRAAAATATPALAMIILSAICSRASTSMRPGIGARARPRRQGAGRSSPDAVPKRPTYTQDWPAYNLAQMMEKHRFAGPPVPTCAKAFAQNRRRSRRQARPQAARCCADQRFRLLLQGLHARSAAAGSSATLQDAPQRGATCPARCTRTSICKYLESDGTDADPAASSLRRAACRSGPSKPCSPPTPPGSAPVAFVRWYDEKYGRPALRQGLGEGARHVRASRPTSSRRSRSRDRDAGDSPAVQARWWRRRPRTSR